MIISGVITSGSLQFSSRAADSRKIALSVLTFLFWDTFHLSLRNSSKPQGTTACRLQTAVLDTPQAVLKHQLPQGYRKPDLSTTFVERWTQTEKKNNKKFNASSEVILHGQLPTAKYTDHKSLFLLV